MKNTYNFACLQYFNEKSICEGQVYTFTTKQNFVLDVYYL